LRFRTACICDANMMSVGFPSPSLVSQPWLFFAEYLSVFNLCIWPTAVLVTHGTLAWSHRSWPMVTFDLAVQYERRLVAGDGKAHVWLMSEFGEEHRAGRESRGASSKLRHEFRRVGGWPNRGPHGTAPGIGQVSGEPSEPAEPAVREGEWSSRSHHGNSSSSQVPLWTSSRSTTTAHFYARE